VSLARNPTALRSLLANLLLGALAWTTLRCVCDNVQTTVGEALLLRWARKLCEHPLRTSVGLGLVLQALLGNSAARRRIIDPVDQGWIPEE